MVLVVMSVVEVSGSVIGESSVEEAKEDVTSVDVKVDSDEIEEDSVKSVGSVVASVAELGEYDDDSAISKKMPLRVGLRDFIVVRVIRIKKVRSLALVVLLFLTRETVWR